MGAVLAPVGRVRAPIRVTSRPASAVRAAGAPAAPGADRARARDAVDGERLARVGRAAIALACVATVAGVVGASAPGRGAGREAALVRPGEAAARATPMATAEPPDPLDLDGQEALHRVIQVGPGGAIADAQLASVAELARAARELGATLVAEPCGAPSAGEAGRMRDALARAIEAAGSARWTWSPLLGGCVLEGGLVLRSGG